MHSKRELHKALRHASEHFKHCADAFTGAEEELKKDNPDMEKVKVFHKDCKTAYLFGKCILDKLNEGELKRKRESDKNNDEVNKNLEDSLNKE